MPFSKIVARNIKERREALGMEAQDFAARLGISKTALSNYDNHTRKWPIDLLPQVADILGVSLDALYGRD